MSLQEYVGRSFVLQHTRYGALDGLVGKVTETRSIPTIEGERDVLVVEVPGAEFPRAIVRLHNFASEVKS